VLPFRNLSADPEQEYFADGVVEDITMALSRFRWLFVIARNSSFTYKGRPVDLEQVSRELGMRYVLEGSVRKAGNRIRIAGQLIDAETGAHLWADRFEGALEDIFDLQDQVTSSVVGAIAPMLQREEIKRARRKPTENLDAYDYYLRGLAKARRWTRDANSEALQLFRKAIEFDPGLACAYGMAAWCYTPRKARRWMIDHVQESAEATRLARKAVTLGADDPVALCMGAYVLAFVAHEFDDAVAFVDRGLAVNPNSAQAWNLSAWVRVWRGEPDPVLDHAVRAMRLNPIDPNMSNSNGAVAYAHFLAGRHDMASSCAEKAMRDNPDFLLAIYIFAASSALAGRLEPAQKVMARACECNPDLLRDLREDKPFKVKPICLVGSPGACKSRLVRRMADLAGDESASVLYVYRFDAAASSDNQFAGTAKAWANTEASVPACAIAQSKTANPVVLVDEIDKPVERNWNGRLREALLPFCDPETSGRYRDQSLDSEIDLLAK
jgi:TolB-like protein